MTRETHVDTRPTPGFAEREINPGCIAVALIACAAGIGALLLVLIVSPWGRLPDPHPGAEDASVARSLAVAVQVYDSQNRTPLAAEGWLETLVAEGILEPDRLPGGTLDIEDAGFFYVPRDVIDTASGRPHRASVYAHPDRFERFGTVVYDDGASAYVDTPEFIEMLERMRRPDGTPFAPHLD
ncbi:MAG: hypothetical protein AAGH64_04170 [Planctomycetota bacterium]